jgi:D-amino peptidase
VRVFISVDIEGCTGITSFTQCGRPSRDHYDWPFARRMLHHDVNAAIRGARAAGATQIVLKDGHGSCRNLLVELLEPGVELISGAHAGRNGMMEGLDSSFDAAMLVGYHAWAGARNGMMDHALVGGLYRCWINGQEAGEIAASAAFAGAHSVPLVCVTSDEVGCDEAARLLPKCEVYATKRGMGRYAGQLLDPTITKPGIEEAAQRGCAGRSAIPPYVIAGPVTFRIAFRTTNEADLASTLPVCTRLDGYTIELTRPDFVTAHSDAYVVFALSIMGRSSEG